MSDTASAAPRVPKRVAAVISFSSNDYTISSAYICLFSYECSCCAPSVFHKAQIIYPGIITGLFDFFHPLNGHYSCHVAPTFLFLDKEALVYENEGFTDSFLYLCYCIRPKSS